MPPHEEHVTEEKPKRPSCLATSLLVGTMRMEEDPVVEVLSSSCERQGGEPNLLDAQVEQEGVEGILEALTEEEKNTMPDANMPLRHFRAEKGNLEEAIRKIKETIAWRKEFEVDKIVRAFEEENEFADILLKENETGKIYVRGIDCDGRAAMYMRPHRENTKSPLDNMRHLVYNLERAIACTNESGKEKINLMIDYDGFRLRDSPPMSTTKWTLTILQNHYPERLYRAYILNPGVVFRTFITFIRPFLDPVTREKIVLCSTKDITKHLVGQKFDLNHVEECAGGAADENDPFGLKPVRTFVSEDYLRSPMNKAF